MTGAICSDMRKIEHGIKHNVKKGMWDVLG